MTLSIILGFGCNHHVWKDNLSQDLELDLAIAPLNIRANSKSESNLLSASSRISQFKHVYVQMLNFVRAQNQDFPLEF